MQFVNYFYCYWWPGYEYLVSRWTACLFCMSFVIGLNQPYPKGGHIFRDMCEGILNILMRLYPVSGRVRGALKNS